MNGHERAFIRAIAESPDDDSPRLIYADALEAGDGGFPRDPERAEFIRLQVELSRMRNRPHGSQKREQKLLHKYRCEMWNKLGRLDNQIALPVSALSFRRGLLDRVGVISWTRVVHHRQVLFEETPVTVLQLATWPEVDLVEVNKLTFPDGSTTLLGTHELIWNQLPTTIESGFNIGLRDCVQREFYSREHLAGIESLPNLGSPRERILPELLAREFGSRVEFRLPREYVYGGSTIHGYTNFPNRTTMQDPRWQVVRGIRQYGGDGR